MPERVSPSITASAFFQWSWLPSTAKDAVPGVQASQGGGQFVDGFGGGEHVVSAQQGQVGPALVGHLHGGIDEFDLCVGKQVEVAQKDDPQPVQ